MRVFVFAAFAALAAGASSPAASAAEVLAPKAIEAGWFDGRTISTTGPRGGRSDFVFSAGGTLTRTGGRAGAAPTQGTWRLDDDGFCMTLGRARRESCYLALANPDGTLRVVRRSGGAFVWSR